MKSHLYIILIISLYILTFLSNKAYSQREFTVVIDPGHGGKDSGCCHNGGQEKKITLAVGLKLGEYIKHTHPNVRVLFTRQRDIFIGLQQRADFANKNKADLFISIHVNSAPSSAPYGAETYVLGLGKQKNNLSVAMRENKAMLLEDDYKTRYKGFDPSSAESYIMFQVMQDAYFNRSIELANELQNQYNLLGRYNRGVRQDILWVLSQSAMPSVLTELGFLTNKREAAFMLSPRGQDKLAKSIAKGFTSYYNKYGDIVRPKQGANKYKTAEELPNSNDNYVSDAKVSGSNYNSSKSRRKHILSGTKSSRYSIKFMCVPQKFDTKDQRFHRLGAPIIRRKYGKYYIYYCGGYSSIKEAKKYLPKVKRYYKDAVITKNN